MRFPRPTRQGKAKAAHPGPFAGRPTGGRNVGEGRAPPSRTAVGNTSRGRLEHHRAGRLSRSRRRWRPRSVVLLAFGIDSFVETTSGLVMHLAPACRAARTGSGGDRAAGSARPQAGGPVAFPARRLTSPSTLQKALITRSVPTDGGRHPAITSHVPSCDVVAGARQASDCSRLRKPRALQADSFQNDGRVSGCR